MKRRPDGELLANVYRRSGEIKRRRRLTRSISAGVVLALLATIPFVLPSSNKPVTKRALSSAAPPIAVVTPTAAPSATACVCAAPPQVKRHLQPTLAQEVQSGQFGSHDVAAVTPFAFASDRSGNWDIYSMDIDGKHLRRLTDDPATERDPAWSPDARHIAFVRLAQPTDTVGDIYTMNADGSNVRHIAVGGRPQWSPDGRSLVFYDFAVGRSGSSNGRIWTIRSDGTGRKMVTQAGANASWMHDGRHLVFGGLQGVSTNVATIAINGSGKKFLTTNPVFAGEPSATASGRIAYVALSGATTALETMDGDGSHQTQITHPTNSDVKPSWSPDGSIIAVERGAEFDAHSAPLGSIGGTGHPVLVFVTADGSGERVFSDGNNSDADPAFPSGLP